jgi:hypothetical protein
MDCEAALRSYYQGMPTALPFEAEIALLVLDTGYTRDELMAEDERFFEVLRVAARLKRASGGKS